MSLYDKFLFAVTLISNSVTLPKKKEPADWSSGLERRDCDQHGLGSKPTLLIL